MEIITMQKLIINSKWQHFLHTLLISNIYTVRPQRIITKCSILTIFLHYGFGLKNKKTGRAQSVS